MSIIDKDSLTRYNIEQAIQKSFNIKKPSNYIDVTMSDGIEISGYAIASQEAHSLNEILDAEGSTVTPYYFAPNGKWSVINLNKIKARWAVRSRQVQDDNGHIWNVVPGIWKNKIFIPDMLSKNVYVEFESLTEHTEHTTQALLPYIVYRSNENINTLVPQVRFGNSLLECIRPLSLETVSINRQGIYINRKFREKLELCDCEEIPRVSQFNLRIFYGKQLLSSTTYAGNLIADTKADSAK